jgi:hypothetical protein
MLLIPSTRGERTIAPKLGDITTLLIEVVRDEVHKTTLAME